MLGASGLRVTGTATAVMEVVAEVEAEAASGKTLSRFSQILDPRRNGRHPVRICGPISWFETSEK